MTEDKHPTWKTKTLKAGVPAKVKILSAKHIAEGTSKYGRWALWPVEVTNQPVENRETKENIVSYTGKAVFFPSPKLEENILKIIDDKENAIIEITKVAIETNDGKFLTSYEVKLVEAGQMPTSSVTYSNNKYVTDFRNLASNLILEENEETFINYGIKEPYHITEDKLKDLWKIYCETYNK